MFIRKKKKNFKPFSKKKGLLIYLSSIKTELALNFLKKKNVCTWPKIGLALKGSSKKVKIEGLGRNISYLACFLTYFHGSRKYLSHLAKKKKTELISLA